MSYYVSPSAGISFTGKGLRSTWLRVLTSICSYFQLFEPCMTGTDERQSRLHQDEGDAKGVSGFVNSHFSWRPPRGVKLGGQRELLLTSLMVQTTSLWLVWTWRNCVAKMHPQWNAFERRKQRFL